MKLFFKIFRAILLTLFVACICVPTATYLLLSSDWAQDRLRELAQKELSGLLGTDVRVGYVKFQPFSRLRIQQVSVDDDFGTEALAIDEIETRAEVIDLILRQKIIIDYAVVRGLELKLYRQDPQAPLNIAGIISRLRSEEQQEPKSFSLRLNSVSLIDCAMTYDVLSAPQTPGRFNPSHIALTNIDTEAFAPCISNTCYHVWLRSMRCSEQSGLKIKNLTAEATLTDHEVSLTKMSVELPDSRLSFNDITAHIDGIQSLSRIGTEIPMNVSLAEGSHISLSDLAPFVPMFDESEIDLNLGFDVTGTVDSLYVHTLRAEDSGRLVQLNICGSILGLRDPGSASASRLRFSASGLPSHTLTSIHATGSMSARLQEILSVLGRTSIDGEFDGSFRQGRLNAKMNTQVGDVDVISHYRRIDHTTDTMKLDFRNSVYDVSADINVDSVVTASILPDKQLNDVTAHLKAQGTLSAKGFDGNVSAIAENFSYKGYRYHNISADAAIEGKNIDATVKAMDPNLNIDARILKNSIGNTTNLKAEMIVSAFRPDSLRLSGKYPGYTLKGRLSAAASGVSVDCFRGTLDLADISFCNAAGDGLKMKQFSVDADNTGATDHVWLTSDFIDGSIEGQITPTKLPRTIGRIVKLVFPGLNPDGASIADEMLDRQSGDNNFTFDFSVDNAENVCRFFHLPVAVVDMATISGEVSAERNLAFVNIDMPWLLSGGNNLMENTSAALRLEGATGDLMGYVTTFFPTIKGPMTVVSSIAGSNGVFDTDIDWHIDRTEPINGNICFNTSLRRDPIRGLETLVDFQPGKINFGNDVWKIHDSHLSYSGGALKVDRFTLTSDEQKLVVDGVAGKSASDTLTVEMDNLHLINIFETLGIYNALLGGKAKGTITGTALFSDERTIESNDTHVDDISYNYCVFGTGDGRMWYDGERKSFRFDMGIAQFNGYHTDILGEIVPDTKELDLKFDANHVNLAFMKPFMAAFSSGVEGTGSGNAHLFGTFEDLDMTGDLYAEEMRLKIDFINVWYSASDSIHIRPGRINLDHLRIHDQEGHSAMVNGYIGHTCFHNAVFDINITDADDLLCYDVPKSMSPDWYGKIYGDGAAAILGKPGEVNISANMRTAPESVFNFELSDFELVDEYSFITFRDATPAPEIQDTIIITDLIPDRVKDIREQNRNAASQSATNYTMDINIDINQDCKVVLVMDPVGGDKIDSRGDGHMRMTYNAADNDLKLYGLYTLESGNYNFTLQDIIIKNFTIKQGSSIRFNGNPFAGLLNIEAYHTVNANLSELDESFLTDKDLNRTIVPVRALMKVRGDMRQPELQFDLEFPTLNSDVYRKVKSIVSTDEMMNRQIIYLLVLNRFYTPEYMSATRGNELFSVASSTIAGQLSSMLGKLSDNWSIAPNLRSDKGDFSDIEVDVNLSSSLLNNRLIFNGNFGYRDKSLNTNQFVGDFDVQYLLTRPGTWRLKAYNRYNDQNYYLRTAQTTQGIGLVFKKDFDSFLSWLKPLQRRKHEESSVDSTLVSPLPADSLKLPQDTVAPSQAN